MLITSNTQSAGFFRLHNPVHKKKNQMHIACRSDKGNKTSLALPKRHLNPFCHINYITHKICHCLVYWTFKLITPVLSVNNMPKLKVARPRPVISLYVAWRFIYLSLLLYYQYSSFPQSCNLEKGPFFHILLIFKCSSIYTYIQSHLLISHVLSIFYENL